VRVTTYTARGLLTAGSLRRPHRRARRRPRCARGRPRPGRAEPPARGRPRARPPPAARPAPPARPAPGRRARGAAGVSPGRAPAAGGRPARRGAVRAGTRRAPSGARPHLAWRRRRLCRPRRALAAHGGRQTPSAWPRSGLGRAQTQNGLAVPPWPRAPPRQAQQRCVHGSHRRPGPREAAHGLERQLPWQPTLLAPTRQPASRLHAGISVAHRKALRPLAVLRTPRSPCAEPVEA